MGNAVHVLNFVRFPVVLIWMKKMKLKIRYLNGSRLYYAFLAGGNAVLSVVSCLVAVWLGHLVAASINHLKGA